MVIQIALWGAVTGLIHFVLVGALYGNPIVDKLYKEAQQNEPGVKHWPSIPKYMITQFLGTQIEVYILAATYIWLRPLVPFTGYTCALVLGAVFSGIRVYPRFWNMWIQSTYPNRLLAIEFVNGIISTFAITLLMQAFM